MPYGAPMQQQQPQGKQQGQQQLSASNNMMHQWGNMQMPAMPLQYSPVFPSPNMMPQNQEAGVVQQNQQAAKPT